MSINERIKKLRKELKMNQTQFAKKIGISQTNLSWLEQDGHKVLERNIRQISMVFKVREEWLKTGLGEKFETSGLLEEFFSDPTLDEIDKKILRSYIKMKPGQRQYIKNWIRSIVQTEEHDELTEASDEKSD